jgi:hypothetical protein
MLVKDYRGKNAEQEMWRFDASLVTQINATLKQAAIEEGQWGERRETAQEPFLVRLVSRRIMARLSLQQARST